MRQSCNLSGETWDTWPWHESPRISYHRIFASKISPEAPSSPGTLVLGVLFGTFSLPFFHGAWFTTALWWVMKTTQHFNISACWAEFASNALHVFLSRRGRELFGQLQRQPEIAQGRGDPMEITPIYADYRAADSIVNCKQSLDPLH